MLGYGQACPVSLGAEVFGERWTPLILRELAKGWHRFNEIQAGIPRMSQSVLVKRLRWLERNGVLERRAGGYHLTQAGLELWEVAERLGAWSQRWLEPKPVDFDPYLVMRWIHLHLRREALPQRRAVVRFDFPRRHKSYWLVLEVGDPDLCLVDHGFQIDLVVTADVEALTLVYLGRQSLDSALSNGSIELEGPREMVSRFPHWFGLSGFAKYAIRRPPELALAK